VGAYDETDDLRRAESIRERFDELWFEQRRERVRQMREEDERGDEEADDAGSP
jgi:hypothetical protein